MEQYQGQELRFYVIANRAAGDTTGFDSPDGALCDPQAVKSRVAAPTVSSAAFAPAAPSQAEFLNGETLQMTRSAAARPAATSLPAICLKRRLTIRRLLYWQMTGKLPLTWKDKADKLAALQTALNEMLKNGDAICIIPESDRQSGGGRPPAAAATARPTT